MDFFAKSIEVLQTLVIAQAAAQGDDQRLQNVDSVSKKAHIHISFRSVELLG